MGTDIHGPWVERYFIDRDGNEHASCIAELPVFDRDYVAFGVIEDISKPRGIPAEPGWQWQRHMAKDVKHGIEHRQRMAADYPGFPAPEPWDWRRNWREEWWRNLDEYRNCFGHSWLTTDEVEEAQRRYIRRYEQWRDDDPATFADREFGPYPGFTIALATMRETERLYGQPCRLVFCFDC